MKLIPGTIVLTEATETPKMETFTVEGATLKKGVATISGTYACTGANYGYVGIMLRQTVGRLNTVEGSNSVYLSGACDGKTKSWSKEVRASEGKYAGGKAFLSVHYDVCDNDVENDTLDCIDGDIDQLVRFNNAPKI